jgi:hypothetical protein
VKLLSIKVTDQDQLILSCIKADFSPLLNFIFSLKHKNEIAVRKILALPKQSKKKKKDVG